VFCRERSERIRNTPWEMPRDAMAGEFCEDAGDGWKHDFRGSLSGFVLSRWAIERGREGGGGGPGEEDGSRNI